MKILIDTHVLLWWLENSTHLPSRNRDEINDGANDIFVSCVTLWEMAIKQALGKLRVPDDLLVVLKQSNISVLPVQPHHIAPLATLPALHRDPFDRMLVSQALAEDLAIMTHDTKIVTPKLLSTNCGV